MDFASPPARPRGDLGVLILWWLACLLAAAVIGWLSVLVQMRFAPLLLLSLLTGLACGSAFAWLLRRLGVPFRKLVVAGTVAASLTTVFSQHYFSYRENVASLQKALDRELSKSPGALMIPRMLPDNFFDYMTDQALQGRRVAGVRLKSGGVWTLWIVEGLLLIAGSLAVVVPTRRQWYCPDCRSWFRETSEGALPSALASEFANHCDLPQGKNIRFRYRLLSCRCGSATGLEIAWDRDRRAATKPGTALLWLTDQGRVEFQQRLKAPG
ncbi:MAG: hypothetical protein N2C14_17235 [Planctomycetales bacterium]